MDVVDSIRKVLSRGTDPERTSETGVEDPVATDRGQRDSNEPDEPRATNLYRCEPCGTTYVSTDLEDCSQCDAPVDRVPTEQDLGLV